MKKTVSLFVLVFLLISGIKAQELPSLKLKNDFGFNNNQSHKTFFSKDVKMSKLQPKRKTVTSYYGAGYTFVIFTSAPMNEAYPVFDTRKGDFLSEINVYFGFAIAKAVTIELEPSILFTNTDRTISYYRNPPQIINGYSYDYVTAFHLGLLSFIPTVNVRFFPFFKQAGFARLIFLGAGAGGAWIREEYDYYGGVLGNYGQYQTYTASTSQWAPVLRLMIGATGSGGQFGFGGELRYNIIPLKQNNEAFQTRIAPNFNSVDLTLRFYFSM